LEVGMSALEVRDAPGPIGAEVVGLDPTRPFDDETTRVLRAAFDRRSVLVLRDVELDLLHQSLLCRMLIGEDLDAELEAEAGPPDDIFYISNRRPDAAAPFGRLPFHSDSMWSHEPYLVLSLYGVEVEAPVAPTFYASAVNGLDTLPEALRARIDGLHARHVSGIINRSADPADEVPIADFGQTLSTVEPLVWTHPRTGRPLLWACEQMTKEIVDLEPDDGEALLLELFAHLYSPANRWEHEWHQGDLVVWDNVAVQHSRPDVAADGPVRTMRKFGTPHPKMDDAKVPTYSWAAEDTPEG
jgi:alpha-ketoglutarate-dependent taurine dioxygenase